MLQGNSFFERTENCSAVFLTFILRFTQQNFNTGYNRASTINLEAFAVCEPSRNTCETKPTAGLPGQPRKTPTEGAEWGNLNFQNIQLFR